MENDVPTAPGATPDSEENNNSSAKASPGPSTVISELPLKGQDNDEQSDGAKTPLSTGKDVNDDAPADVTIESKQQSEGKATPSETPDAQEHVDPTEEPAGEIGKDDMKEDGKEKDVGAGKSVENEDNDTREEHAQTELQKEDSVQEKVHEKPPEEANDDGEHNGAVEVESLEPKTDETIGTDQNDENLHDEKEDLSKMNSDTGNNVSTESTDKTVKGDGDDNETAEENQGVIDSVPSPLNLDEGSKDGLESAPMKGSLINEGSKDENGYLADNETTTLQSLDSVQTNKTVAGGGGDASASAGDTNSGIIKEGDVIEVVQEEPLLSHEDLLTKYHATELQLDGMREENVKLHERIKELENELRQLKEGEEDDDLKRRDGYRVHTDMLARELSQTQDAEKFLKEKVAELLEEREDGEKKIKDLQLRLKRFAKDDKAKDERMTKMDAELKEITGIIEELETYVDEETRLKIQAKRMNTRQSTTSAPTDNSHTKVSDISKMNTNRSYRDPQPVVRSRTCVIF